MYQCPGLCQSKQSLLPVSEAVWIEAFQAWGLHKAYKEGNHHFGLCAAFRRRFFFVVLTLKCSIPDAWGVATTEVRRGVEPRLTCLGIMIRLRSLSLWWDREEAGRGESWAPGTSDTADRNRRTQRMAVVTGRKAVGSCYLERLARSAPQWVLGY